MPDPTKSRLLIQKLDSFTNLCDSKVVCILYCCLELRKAFLKREHLKLSPKKELRKKASKEGYSKDRKIMCKGLRECGSLTETFSMAKDKQALWHTLLY